MASGGGSGGGGALPMTPELRSFLDSFETRQGAPEPPQAPPGPPAAAPQVVLPDPAIAGAVAASSEASQQALVSYANAAAAGAIVPVAPQPAQPAAAPAAADPNRLEGVVIDWRESYGFIQFHDGRRAYVHNSMCGGTSLLPGQAVTGICMPDAKNPGKWQAQQVERKILMTTDGRLEGKVQQWTGNFGFIQFCDGRRAFCHGSFLTGAAAGASLFEGQSIIGTVQEDPKNPGKWQAQNVEVVPSLAPDNSGRIEGKVMQWNGSYGFIQFSDGRRAYVHSSACANANTMGVGATVFGNLVEEPANSGHWQAQSVEAEAGRLEGIVTQWSEKGFGFIDFVDGRHAFVHSSACGGKHLSQGEAVSAIIMADQQNPGKWMAKGVIVKGPPGEDCMVTEWHETGSWGQVVLDTGSPALIHAGSFGDGGSLALGLRLRVTTTYDTAKAQITVEQVTGVAELSVQQLAEAAKLVLAAQAKSEAEAAAAEGAPPPPPPPLADTGQAAPVVAALVPHAQSVPGAAPPPPPPPATAPGGPAAPPTLVGQPSVVLPPAAAAPAAAAPAAPVAPALPAPVVAAPLVKTFSPELSSLASSLGIPLPGLAGGPPAQESPPSTVVRISGKVSEWNSSGFGFAMMDDGRRVYVHTSQCGGQHLQQAEAITAAIVPDPRNPGKWAAQNVERLGGAAPAIAAGLAQPLSQGALASAVATASLAAEQAAKRQRFAL